MKGHQRNEGGPLLDGSCYLDNSRLQTLKEVYKVEPVEVCQRLGDALVVPALSVYQVSVMLWWRGVVVVVVFLL